MHKLFCFYVLFALLYTCYCASQISLSRQCCRSHKLFACTRYLEALEAEDAHLHTQLQSRGYTIMHHKLHTRMLCFTTLLFALLYSCCCALQISMYLQCCRTLEPSHYRLRMHICTCSCKAEDAHCMYHKLQLKALSASTTLLFALLYTC